MLCSRCQRFFHHVAAEISVQDADDTRDGDAPAQPKLQWPRRQTTELHSDLAHLRAASDARCPVCRAIYFTPTEYEQTKLPEDCKIHFVLESRDEAHPVLSASFHDETGTRILIPNRIVAIYSGLVTDDELASTLSKCAGLDNSSTGSDPSFQLACFWLKRCLETHAECSKFETSPLFMPTRVIDVSGGKVRLVATADEAIREPDKRYIALSHCWGKIQIITTKKSTLKERLQGISMNDLSKTFQNAVEATRKLGFRYLWIDSLCIIQDDGDDWEAEAAQMCKIYQKAVLTIAAAHAPGGDIGLFKQRDGILQLPFILDLPAEKARRRLHVMFTSYGRSEGLGGPEPPLYGRAWVLQEQILSPRMLIFDGSQLRWECLCMHGSERSPQGGMSRHIGHHKTIRSGIMEDREFFKLPEFDDFFASRHQHQEWCYAVMDYTHRGMTKPSDRLVAISGIADAVKSKTQNQYLAGLWMDQLWLGLLWSIPHEAEYTPTTMHAFDLEANTTIRHAKPIAPSWSWVSVTAPVVYPVPAVGTVFIQRMCEIIGATTQGSPSRQTGAIRLRGHVRTGYVNSVYPYAIREAADRYPKMQFRKPDGTRTLMTHRGRSFHPNDFFLFSRKRPRGDGDWQLTRGLWRPDEVLDPRTEITFVAVAQQGKGSATATHRDGDPLQVFALGLVPTGRAPGEYRRVGYAVWDNCAWYGYICGVDNTLARDWRPTSHRWVWEMVEAMRWRSPVAVKVEAGAHDHNFKADQLPEEKLYQDSVGIRTGSLVIV